MMKSLFHWLKSLGVGNAVPSFCTRYVKELAMLALLLAGFQSSALAANHYIRAGASGANNGSSWTDAWTHFSSVSWIRLDTYYVAGGTFSENVLVTTAISGTNWITLKKANATDNSNDPGWDSSYETLQTVIAGSFESYYGYLEVDGVTGSGTAGHGIQIWNTNTTPPLYLGGSAGTYHIFHTEIKGAGAGVNYANYDGVSLNNATANQKGFHVASCWVHEANRNGVTLGGLVGTSYADYGMLFESNVVSETGNCLNVAAHGQGLQISYGAEDGFTIIRNNTFRNIAGTGMIAWLAGTGSIHHDAEIYNNIFYTTNASIYNVSPGVITSLDTCTAATNIFIANNTFYNLDLAEIRIWGQQSTNGNSIVNNVFEGCNFTDVHSGVATNLNNGYYGNTGKGVPTGTPGQVNGSSTTFVGAAAGDFRLLPQGYAVGSVVNLSSYFTTDFSGATRGSQWALGAYQSGARPSSVLGPIVLIGQNPGEDADPVAPGRQVLAGQTYSYMGGQGPAPWVAWQWTYSKNGAPAVVYLSGTGLVRTVSFEYPGGSSGDNYVWRLQVDQGTGMHSSAPWEVIVK
jgi:hypothetical protein